VIIATRHDLHAELVIAGLNAGKHIFVEKPLCLTAEQLAEVERCLAELGDRAPILMVGFNRRFSEGLRLLSAEFAAVRPLSIQYRFAVPELPPDTWVHDDEVGGGRIIGEACHAIDACAAIAGSPVVRVSAESAGTADTLARSDDRVFVTMRHMNGSISSVAYQAGGDRAAPAERIEVIGGGKTAVLDNWSELTVWSGGRRKHTRLNADKGHATALDAFITACRKGGAPPISFQDLYSSSLASILAERSTREGMPFELELP
jgi:predicted dehydrogenase